MSKVVKHSERKKKCHGHKIPPLANPENYPENDHKPSTGDQKVVK